MVIPEPKKKLENWKSSLGLDFKDFKPKRSKSKQSKKNLHKSPEKSPVQDSAWNEYRNQSYEQFKAKFL